MSSDKDFVDFTVEQLGDAGRITYRKMFGEYGICCDDKLLFVITDYLLSQPKKGECLLGMCSSPRHTLAQSYIFWSKIDLKIAAGSVI